VANGHLAFAKRGASRACDVGAEHRGINHSRGSERAQGRPVASVTSADLATIGQHQNGVLAGLQDHLAATVRSLIVDEVFDANEFDIRVIELALAAGIEITIIFDPWQACTGSVVPGPIWSPT
jgi:hypothetical protein